MNIIKLIIEFIVIFTIIFLIYYFFIIKKCQKDKKSVPAEVNLIILKHKIDVKKIDLYQMTKVVSIVTVTILSIVITIVNESFNNNIVALLVGTLISIMIALIAYHIIGNIYEDKGKKVVKKK